MVSIRHHHVTLKEYGSPQDIASLARSCGRSPSELIRLLESAASRISRLVGVDEPLRIERGACRIRDVAGFLQIAPDVNLEIVPKFLDYNNQYWKNDFFLIALLVKYGRILASDTLPANPSKRHNLADVIGHAIVVLIDQNIHRPVRVYQRRSWSSFDLDGEIEPVSLLDMQDEGFLQHGIILDRRNEVNRLIMNALGLLVDEVHDRDLRRQIVRRRWLLSPQLGHGAIAKHGKLPSRYSNWKDIVAISDLVLRGLGLSYESTGTLTAPGFMLNTFRSWESIIFMALKVGMSRDVTVGKRAFFLGIRSRAMGAGSSIERPISVIPDAEIRTKDAIFLVDAKYKHTFNYSAGNYTQISSADLYESLAFLRAAKTRVLILIYPIDREELSRSRNFDVLNEIERLKVDDNIIVGVGVSLQGISARDGFRRFSEALCSNLQSLVEEEMKSGTG